MNTPSENSNKPLKKNSAPETPGIGSATSLKIRENIVACDVTLPFEEKMNKQIEDLHGLSVRERTKFLEAQILYDRNFKAGRNVSGGRGTVYILREINSEAFSQLELQIQKYFFDIDLHDRHRSNFQFLWQGVTTLHDQFWDMKHGKETEFNDIDHDIYKGLKEIKEDIKILQELQSKERIYSFLEFTRDLRKKKPDITALEVKKNVDAQVKKFAKEQNQVFFETSIEQINDALLNYHYIDYIEAGWTHDFLISTIDAYLQFFEKIEDIQNDSDIKNDSKEAKYLREDILKNLPDDPENIKDRLTEFIFHSESRLKNIEFQRLPNLAERESFFPNPEEHNFGQKYRTIAIKPFPVLRGCKVKAGKIVKPVDLRGRNGMEEKFWGDDPLHIEFNEFFSPTKHVRAQIMEPVRIELSRQQEIMFECAKEIRVKNERAGKLNAEQEASGKHLENLRKYREKTLLDSIQKIVINRLKREDFPVSSNKTKNANNILQSVENDIRGIEIEITSYRAITGQSDRFNTILEYLKDLREKTNLLKKAGTKQNVQTMLQNMKESLKSLTDGVLSEINLLTNEYNLRKTKKDKLSLKKADKKFGVIKKGIKTLISTFRSKTQIDTKELDTYFIQPLSKSIQGLEEYYKDYLLINNGNKNGSQPKVSGIYERLLTKLKDIRNKINGLKSDSNIKETFNDLNSSFGMLGIFLSLFEKNYKYMTEYQYFVKKLNKNLEEKVKIPDIIKEKKQILEEALKIHNKLLQKYKPFLENNIPGMREFLLKLVAEEMTANKETPEIKKALLEKLRSLSKEDFGGDDIEERHAHEEVLGEQAKEIVANSKLIPELIEKNPGLRNDFVEGHLIEADNCMLLANPEIVPSVSFLKTQEENSLLYKEIFEKSCYTLRERRKNDETGNTEFMDIPFVRYEAPFANEILNYKFLRTLKLKSLGVSLGDEKLENTANSIKTRPAAIHLMEKLRCWVSEHGELDPKIKNLLNKTFTAFYEAHKTKKDIENIHELQQSLGVVLDKVITHCNKLCMKNWEELFDILGIPNANHETLANLFHIKLEAAVDFRNLRRSDQFCRSCKTYDLQTASYDDDLKGEKMVCTPSHVPKHSFALKDADEENLQTAEVVADNDFAGSFLCAVEALVGRCNSENSLPMSIGTLNKSDVMEVDQQKLLVLGMKNLRDSLNNNKEIQEAYPQPNERGNFILTHILKWEFLAGIVLNKRIDTELLTLIQNNMINLRHLNDSINLNKVAAEMLRVTKDSEGILRIDAGSLVRFKDFLWREDNEDMGARDIGKEIKLASGLIPLNDEQQQRVSEIYQWGNVEQDQMRNFSHTFSSILKNVVYHYGNEPCRDLRGVMPHKIVNDFIQARTEKVDDSLKKRMLYSYFFSLVTKDYDLPNDVLRDKLLNDETLTVIEEYLSGGNGSPMLSTPPQTLKSNIQNAMQILNTSSPDTPDSDENFKDFFTVVSNFRKYLNFMKNSIKIMLPVKQKVDEICNDLKKYCEEALENPMIHSVLNKTACIYEEILLPATNLSRFIALRAGKELSEKQWRKQCEYQEDSGLYGIEENGKYYDPAGYYVGYREAQNYIPPLISEKKYEEKIEPALIKIDKDRKAYSKEAKKLLKKYYKKGKAKDGKKCYKLNNSVSPEDTEILLEIFSRVGYGTFKIPRTISEDWNKVILKKLRKIKNEGINMRKLLDTYYDSQEANTTKKHILRKEIPEEDRDKLMVFFKDIEYLELEVKKDEFESTVFLRHLGSLGDIPERMIQKLETPRQQIESKYQASSEVTSVLSLLEGIDLLNQLDHWINGGKKKNPQVIRKILEKLSGFVGDWKAYKPGESPIQTVSGSSDEKFYYLEGVARGLEKIINNFSKAHSVDNLDEWKNIDPSKLNRKAIQELRFGIEAFNTFVDKDEEEDFNILQNAAKRKEQSICVAQSKKQEERERALILSANRQKLFMHETVYYALKSLFQKCDQVILPLQRALEHASSHLGIDTDVLKDMQEQGEEDEDKDFFDLYLEYTQESGSSLKPKLYLATQKMVEAIKNLPFNFKKSKDVPERIKNGLETIKKAVQYFIDKYSMSNLSELINKAPNAQIEFLVSMKTIYDKFVHVKNDEFSKIFLQGLPVPELISLATFSETKDPKTLYQYALPVVPESKRFTLRESAAYLGTENREQIRMAGLQLAVPRASEKERERMYDEDRLSLDEIEEYSDVESQNNAALKYTLLCLKALLKFKREPLLPSASEQDKWPEKLSIIKRGLNFNFDYLNNDPQNNAIIEKIFHETHEYYEHILREATLKIEDELRLIIMKNKPHLKIEELIKYDEKALRKLIDDEIKEIDSNTLPCISDEKKEQILYASNRIIMSKSILDTVFMFAPEKEKIPYLFENLAFEDRCLLAEKIIYDFENSSPDKLDCAKIYQMMYKKYLGDDWKMEALEHLRGEFTFLQSKPANTDSQMERIIDRFLGIAFHDDFRERDSKATLLMELPEADKDSKIGEIEKYTNSLITESIKSTVLTEYARHIEKAYEMLTPIWAFANEMWKNLEDIRYLFSDYSEKAISEVWQECDNAWFDCITKKFDDFITKSSKEQKQIITQKITEKLKGLPLRQNFIPSIVDIYFNNKTSLVNPSCLNLSNRQTKIWYQFLNNTQLVNNGSLDLPELGNRIKAIIDSEIKEITEKIDDKNTSQDSIDLLQKELKNIRILKNRIEWLQSILDIEENPEELQKSLNSQSEFANVWKSYQTCVNQTDFKKKLLYEQIQSLREYLKNMHGKGTNYKEWIEICLLHFAMHKKETFHEKHIYASTANKMLTSIMESAQNPFDKIDLDQSRRIEQVINQDTFKTYLKTRYKKFIGYCSEYRLKKGKSISDKQTRFFFEQTLKMKDLFRRKKEEVEKKFKSKQKKNISGGGNQVTQVIRRSFDKDLNSEKSNIESREQITQNLINLFQSEGYEFSSQIFVECLKVMVKADAEYQKNLLERQFMDELTSTRSKITDPKKLKYFLCLTHLWDQAKREALVNEYTSLIDTCEREENFDFSSKINGEVYKMIKIWCYDKENFIAVYNLDKDSDKALMGTSGELLAMLGRALEKYLDEQHKELLKKGVTDIRISTPVEKIL